jgi:tetratricopeptide (TPR) repeat protein
MIVITVAEIETRPLSLFPANSDREIFMVELKEVSMQECEQRLAHNPQSLIFSRLADCYRKRGDIERAIDVCSQGLNSHPDSITGRVILGRCYLEQEKYQEAATEFTKVIEQDRRNQVALKMLADVYTHQGMTEKAGDIYAFLLKVDPGNQSIVNLAAHCSGSGTTNIYRVLGFSEAALQKSVNESDSALAGDSFSGNQQPVQPLDSFQDPEKAFAQTMRMDPQELRQESVDQNSNAFASRGSAIEELNPPMTQHDGSGVEEFVGDLPANDDGSVTGDDITARMSMMFKEEDHSSEISSSPTELDNRALFDSPVTSNEKRTDFAATTESVVEEVSGNDISNRIEQLFGESAREETKAPVQASASDYSQMFDSSQPTAPLSEQQEPILTADVDQGESGNMLVEEEGQTDVSGEDIVTRMSEIFEKTAEVVSQISDVLGESPLREKGSAIFPEGSDSSDASGLDLPEEPETLEEGTISGDDIARRLETIFEEEEAVSLDIVSEAATQNAVIQGEENSVLEVTQETETPIMESVSFEDALKTTVEQLSIETDIQDISNDDIAPFIEQAQAGDRSDAANKTTDSDSIASLKESSPQEINESLDDALPSEEPPDMSGDDVRTRLEEIFPDSLSSEETLSLVNEIPDGEKDNETPNQGFYTMSGDDAVAKIPEESLLKQLDEVEIDLSSGDKSVIETSTAQPPELNSSETDVAMDEESALEEDSLPVSDTAETGNLDSIPDHVLTPTLADIYFQQGQPNLAVQIYSRLLEKDPDNEKISKRLETIKSFIAKNVQTIATPKAEKPEQSEFQEPDKKPVSPKNSRKKPATFPKPLAGVRIKKKKK